MAGRRSMSTSVIAALTLLIGVLGGIEPWALRDRFGCEVVASAAYPLPLLVVFNHPAWRAPFARASAPDSGES